MRSLKNLFDNNRRWAEEQEQSNPAFFEGLASGQSPEYLWIGCSDSRVPANEIVGLPPGELFVHRNVANQVIHTDINCLSVIQFAVEALKVKHIIVCGHYNCGGIKAALEDNSSGAINSWLRHIQDVYEDFQHLFRDKNEKQKIDAMCELNVLAQARHVCRTGIVRQAWKQGQELMVHSWIYALNDGRLRDLKYSPAAISEVESSFENALLELGLSA